MSRAIFFKNFYGRFEVLVDVGSGLFLVFGTSLFMHQYVLGFESEMLSPALIFMARSFGMMVFISGLLQFAVINYGGKDARKWALIGLAIGDSMQIILSALFFEDYGVWTALYIFNFIFTPMLLISRSFFLLTGVPDRN